ncbi:hypothetical protein POPTR_014G044700v4 [Populus trichocarpa]|jgi:hypothetical protein|uniref:Uncharacterized protein n=1 Tax=Populus trichocarpa TaxID=3694 RepID=B9MVB4_POPTR|nr:hypothetical protein BDE02_14G036100 [Populus trichocarpa]PNT02996.1 hypothetical protein POPTR_014G044700v4 [Populus trichocarpa]
MKPTRKPARKFPKQSPDHPPIQKSSSHDESKIIVRLRTNSVVTKSDVKKSEAASSAPTPSDNVVGPSTVLQQQQQEKQEDVAKSATGSRGNKKGMTIKKQGFSISLTKAEIELDFLQLSGVKPKRKPRKRDKDVQTALDSTFPGLKLQIITSRDYRSKHK